MLFSVVWLICIVSLLAWLGLLLHPDFPYLYREKLPLSCSDTSQQDLVSVIIPCRNEETLLPQTLASILVQDYPHVEVIVVDDNSSDNTAQIARSLAQQQSEVDVKVIQGQELAAGWAGKIWALEQGIAQARGRWLWLSDADILYAPGTLSSLMGLAKKEQKQLVSVMARLQTQSFWEKLLVPAFVYFFKVLYPFRAVADHKRRLAAAAGGCMLIQRQALEKIGGIAAIRGELIDDVALGKKIKNSGGNISLVVSPWVKSIRPYLSLAAIWQMVARSAFTQLRYSYLLLALCVSVMVVVFAGPLLGIVMGGCYQNSLLLLMGLGSYLAMSASYYPSTRYFAVSPVYSFLLPFVGGLYLLMTLDSACCYLLGRKANWKGRVYQAKESSSD